jgi:hypothetical protein
MKKIIALIFAICVLSSVLVAQSHYKTVCFGYGFDDAVLTIHGVYCKTNKVEVARQYMPLSDLIEREEKNQRITDPRLKQIFHEDNW